MNVDALCAVIAVPWIGAVVLVPFFWLLMLGPEPALLDFYTLFLPGTVLFHYMGVLIGGYIGVVIAKESMGLTHLVGDIFAPALALMMTIVRVGCFLGGCCYGKPTDLPWAIELHGARRHPTQLYELFFQLAFFGLLWYLRDRMPRPGDLMKLYWGGLCCLSFLQRVLARQPRRGPGHDRASVPMPGHPALAGLCPAHPRARICWRGRVVVSWRLKPVLSVVEASRL